MSLFVKAGSAYTQQDPLWPCIQAKVEKISVRQVWQGKLQKEIPQKYFEEDSVIELSRKLNDILIPEIEIQKTIQNFSKNFQGKEKENKLSAVFLLVFDNLSFLRKRTLVKIKTTMANQIKLQKKIDDLLLQIKNLRKSKPNELLQNRLAEQYEWKIRVFNDRRELIPYFCERPIEYEKRVYYISRQITEIVNEAK